MTTVVHCKKASYDIYIGRPSKWGNPFVIGRDGTRNDVMMKYRDMLRGRPDIIDDIRRELAGKVLGCWCKPLRCHGDILAHIANCPDGASACMVTSPFMELLDREDSS